MVRDNWKRFQRERIFPMQRLVHFGSLCSWEASTPRRAGNGLPRAQTKSEHVSMCTDMRFHFS
jgi:hypothetical protein